MQRPASCCQFIKSTWGCTSLRRTGRNNCAACARRWCWWCDGKICFQNGCPEIQRLICVKWICEVLDRWNCPFCVAWCLRNTMLVPSDHLRVRGALVGAAFIPGIDEKTTNVKSLKAWWSTANNLMSSSYLLHPPLPPPVEGFGTSPITISLCFLRKSPVWYEKSVQSIGFTMDSMRFCFEKSSKINGFTWETMRFCYKKSSKTIGFTLEIMRFCYERSSKTIGFTMESMSFGYEQSSKTIGFTMETSDLGWEVSSNHWIVLWDS